MYEHKRRQSLTVHMFFKFLKMNVLLYNNKNIVVDGCARLLAERGRNDIINNGSRH